MSERSRCSCNVADGIAPSCSTAPSRNALDLPMCHELRAAFERSTPTRRARGAAERRAGRCSAPAPTSRSARARTPLGTARRLASFAAYAAIERCAGTRRRARAGRGRRLRRRDRHGRDFIVAGGRVSFRFPEPHWGTVGATQRLQRVIGKRRAKELLFTNRALMPVEEAADCGLVSRVVSRRAADGGGRDVASIAKAPPLAMALTKHAVDLGAETDLDRGIRIELAAIEQCLADGGWRDGVAGFTTDPNDRPARRCARSPPTSLRRARSSAPDVEAVVTARPDHLRRARRRVAPIRAALAAPASAAATASGSASATAPLGRAVPRDRFARRGHRAGQHPVPAEESGTRSARVRARCSSPTGCSTSTSSGCCGRCVPRRHRPA